MGLVVRMVVDSSHKFVQSEESVIAHIRRLEDCPNLCVVIYGFVLEIIVLWGAL
jgi:hypothetical protein